MSYYGDIKTMAKLNDVIIGKVPDDFKPMNSAVVMASPLSTIQINMSRMGELHFYNYGEAITAATSMRFYITYIT